jgi:Transposase
MSKGSGISRSDRRRNARRERLRGLLPRDGAVLGIDLGDAKQALALAGHDMRVLWRRSPRCAAHQLGGPIAEAAEAAARAGMPRLTVACEPAGSRWMQVQRLCREAGAALVCVQPLVSHIAREQEDCTGHKRDEPDAVLIARLASELHCYVPEELDESWAFLRQLGRRRAQLVTAATAAVLRVRDFLPVAWPSAVTAAGDPFKSMTWLAAVEVATSRCGGDPARLAAAGEEEFLALVRDAAPGWGTPRPGRRIARKVLALADDPGAVGWSRRGLFRRVRDELGDLQRARRQLKEAEADMAALLAGLGLEPARGHSRAHAGRRGGHPGRDRRPPPLRDLFFHGQARRAVAVGQRVGGIRGRLADLAARPALAARRGLAGDVRDAELAPRGQLFRDVTPAGAPLQRERHVITAGEPRQPGPQVRTVGRSDLTAFHLPGQSVEVVERDLLPVDVKPACDGHRDLLKLRKGR